tara:strand:- start:237 stop:464 length:228 start_codon:yes stop_codon:yes gene_type:complete
MEKKIMKQISNANELVRSAKKSHVEMYDPLFEKTILHTCYEDKETNKQYFVGIDITDLGNVKICNIEEIINEVAQ